MCLTRQNSQVYFEGRPERGRISRQWLVDSGCDDVGSVNAGGKARLDPTEGSNLGHGTVQVYVGHQPYFWS
jgi:hypothetical protein